MCAHVSYTPIQPIGLTQNQSDEHCTGENWQDLAERQLIQRYKDFKLQQDLLGFFLKFLRLYCYRNRLFVILVQTGTSKFQIS